MHRVVITGYGAVTPLGNDVDTVWTNMKEMKTGIDRLTRYNPDSTETYVSGEVKDFDPTEYMERREYSRMDLFSQYAVAAASQALAMSEYEINDETKENVGTIISTGIGGIIELEKGARRMIDRGARRMHPLLIPMIIGNMAAANVAINTGAEGASLDIVTACASGTNALGEAFLKIKFGLLDAALAGGSEASINELAMGGFSSLRATSPSKDPNTASRPFDKDRDGFVMSEGGAVLFIESLESAQARGAEIYGEIVGYGTNSDAFHMTAPKEDGSGAAKAMELAIEMAGIDKSEVDYINAHGTSTPINDRAETMSIKSVFGEDTKIPVSSSKGHLGHMTGAAGAMEAIILAKALQEGYIPATRGLENPDLEAGMDLDYVPHEGREADLKYAISNSLGFGGHNASIIVKRWEGQ